MLSRIREWCIPQSRDWENLFYSLANDARFALGSVAPSRQQKRAEAGEVLRCRLLCHGSPGHCDERELNGDRSRHSYRVTHSRRAFKPRRC